MSETLASYLPQDRLRALARDETLPDFATGTALFADISGFTPLTEQFTQQLGPRRGIEELTRRINAVYDALIGAIERYGGSAVGFAGDGMTCWFDDGGASWQLAPQPSAGRAVAAAFALQSAMRTFPDLAIKAAVASGPVRRFVVGDPAVQKLDTLAGATLTRLANAEHLAGKGEVVADAATLTALGDTSQIGKWCTAGDERFAILSAPSQRVLPAPLPPLMRALTAEELRPWVLPAVFAREQGGLGAFLTELRPAIPLFMSFGDLDYDKDNAAGAKLDAVICRAQAIVNHYEGALLQLTIGDKGSYLYANFGAVAAHEDDARRAVQAALDLKALPKEFPFLQEVRIGVTSGTLRVGAYGGVTRRTFGALGDDVNLAARLMRAAASKILVSQRVQTAAAGQFSFAPQPPLAVKGKTGLLSVFAVTSASRRGATRLQEPVYRLPMIGRQDELALIAEKLALARADKGQVIGITAEAGMGKSRLVAEAIRLAQGQGFTGYGGACESSGTNTAYLAWKSIWQAFFDLDPTLPVRQQLGTLEGRIERYAAHRLSAMPVLAVLLDLPIVDNDFTRTLEPKDRRNVLTAILEDCLKAAAREEPLLFVLEDVHWIDPLSHDLTEALARVSADLPVCFILAYRPFELARLQAPRVEALPHFSKLTLHELTPDDSGQLMRAKLAQLYPGRAGDPPIALVEQLTAKAQGNPFYLEELLNHLYDRGVDPWGLADPKGLLSELPDSLHSLVLSRIDQLSEAQKATLKVASIIGRLFPFAWLHGYYPALGAPAALKANLNELARLELTPLDTPEPELAYLFKHIVTQEAAYESLAYATRAQLHEMLAQFLETQGGAPLLDALAYHYSRSENVPKQHEYLRKAGEASQIAYANAAALDYYERLLPLLEDAGEQVDIRLKLAEVLELLGCWDEAEMRCQQALTQTTGDAPRTAACQFELGRLSRYHGDYAAALEWLTQARTQWAMCSNQAGQGRALTEIGMVFFEGRGEYADASEPLREGLKLAQEAGDQAGVATSLNVLGAVAQRQGDRAAMRALHEESLAMYREIGDRRGVGRSLGNLGVLARDQSDYIAARALHEESLAVFREIGDKRLIAVALGNLGRAALGQGDFAAARNLLEEALALAREIGDKHGICAWLTFLGDLASLQADYVVARALYEESLVLYGELGDKPGIAWSLFNLGSVAFCQADYATAQALYHESLALFREIGHTEGIAAGLAGLAGIAAESGRNSASAAQLAGTAEATCVAIGLTLQPVERGIYERAVAAAKAALGEEAFNAAFAAGQRMSLDEAVAFALGE